MNLHKSLSVLLIASQISFTSLALAGEGATVSPEATLLENVYSLQGQNLPMQEKIDRSQQSLAAYLSTANLLGGQERFQQALVTLGIFTPAQAVSFEADAQSAAERLSSANPTDAQDQSSLITQEVVRLAEMVPSGAQFSICSVEENIGIPIIGSAVVGIGALLSESGKTTCASQSCVNSNPEPATTIVYVAGAVMVAAMVFGIVFSSVQCN